MAVLKTLNKLSPVPHFISCFINYLAVAASCLQSQNRFHTLNESETKTLYTI